MNQQFLSEEKLNDIMDQARQRSNDITINIDVEQALLIMLRITHIFKFEMDRKSVWSHTLERIQEEADDFYAITGMKGMEPRKNKIDIDGLSLFHINIQDILLQTLYALNGSYYNINEQDSNWDTEFNRIFVEMTYGKEFDRAIISFLLLPLYNSTHDKENSNEIKVSRLTGL